MPKKRELRSKALQFAYDRYVGEDPELAAAFEEELSSADIASQICNLRKRAGLSQRQLAAKVGHNGVSNLSARRFGLRRSLPLHAQANCAGTG